MAYDFGSDSITSDLAYNCHYSSLFYRDYEVSQLRITTGMRIHNVSNLSYIEMLQILANIPSYFPNWSFLQNARITTKFYELNELTS